MARKNDKLTRGAHIKRHTKGTSNEISFSVLDAAKEALDGELSELDKRAPHFGGISLFTLPGRRKKPTGTPTKEEGLPLSTGDFVSVEGKEPGARFDAFDFATPAMTGARLGKGREVAGSTGRTGALSAAARQKSLPAAPAKPVRSPEEEIARRKARRRLSKVVAVSVIVLITVALLGAGGTYLYHEMQRQQDNVMELDGALTLISQADETIKALDAVLADPFAAESSKARETVQANLEAAADNLDGADVKARTASADLRDSREKEAANQAVAGVAARQTLLDAGSQMLAALQEAESAVAGVDAAWELVLEADGLARDAAQLVTDTTAENVQASKDKSIEAVSAFNQAFYSLSDIQATYPAADLSPLTTYVEKRIESLGYAIASDDAFLARNKEDAATQNDAYNAADLEAVALAKSIPNDPASIVRDAYVQSVAELEQTYSTARLQAGTADAFIHDYLGTESK